jgi:hypothetical protein
MAVGEIKWIGHFTNCSPDVTCCRGWPAVTPYQTYKLPAGSESVVGTRHFTAPKAAKKMASLTFPFG